MENDRKILFRTAGAGSRLSAYVIDWLIQADIILLFILICVNILIDDFDSALITNSLGTFLFVLGFSFFIVGFIYDFICDTLFFGITVGKKIFGLKVVRTKGGKLKVAQSILRNLIKHSLDFFAGIFYVIFSRDRKSISDKIAGTRVIAYKANIDTEVYLPKANTNILNESDRHRLTLTDYEYTILREFFIRQEVFDEGNDISGSGNENRIFKILQKHFCRTFGVPPNEINEKTMQVLLMINVSIRDGK